MTRLYYNHYIEPDPGRDEILIEYGWEGVGLYYGIMEVIHKNGGVWPVGKAGALALRLAPAGKELVSSILEACLDNDLLYEENGYIMAEVVDHSLKISRQNKKAAEARWKKKKQLESKGNADAMQLHGECTTDAEQTQSECNAIAHADKIREEESYNPLSPKGDCPPSGDCELNFGCESHQSGIAKPMPVASVSHSPGKKPKHKRFQKPTLEEVRAYCRERKNQVDPDTFIDHYEANGWKIGGKAPMKDWKAAVRTWEKNTFGRASPHPKVSGCRSDKEREEFFKDRKGPTALPD